MQITINKTYSEPKGGRVVIPLTGLMPPHFCVCPMLMPEILGVVVILCSVSSVEMGGDCSFC